jgi:hypothetical protein
LMNARTPQGALPLALYLMVVTTVTAIYWVTWFLIPGGQLALAAMPGETCHAIFENSFPASDGWMAACSAIAAWHLLRGNAQAIPWLFMAGSAGMYLLGMDVLYDLQNGVYGRLRDPATIGAVLTEMLVNLGTLVFASWSLLWARHNRSWRESR